jgi:hypothetical protein
MAFAASGSDAIAASEAAGALAEVCEPGFAQAFNAIMKPSMTSSPAGRRVLMDTPLGDNIRKVLYSA